MVSVLFVCLGNICRSPMAEAIFRHYVQEAGLGDKIRVDSAGTGEWHVGNPPHMGTQQKLQEQGISSDHIQARQVRPQDFTDFHYIIGMDNSNVENLEKLAGDLNHTKIYRFVDFMPGTTYDEIPDPYFTGDFDETYTLVKFGCKFLLQKIQDELKQKES